MKQKKHKSPINQEILSLVDLFASQEYDTAESLAKSLIKRYPKDSFGYKALGAIYTETKRCTLAIEPMKKAISLDPHDPELRANLGNAYKDLRQLNEAEKSYRKALQIDPSYSAVHSNLGVILKDAGKYRDAEQSYRNALRYTPNDAEVLVRLGYVLMSMGLKSQAEDFFRKSLDVKPYYSEAIQCLALLMAHMQRPDEAEAFYQQALAISPDSFELYNNRGNLLKELGRYKEAEESYRIAQSLNSTSATVFNNIGMIIHEQGRLLEAEANYRISLALQPDFPEAVSNLGVTLMELGMLSEAISLYQEALSRRPDHEILLTNLGCVYKEIGMTDEAVNCFRKAIEIAPDFRVASSNLLFTLNYGATNNPVDMKAEAEAYGRSCTRTANSPFGEWRALDNGPLRVGFVSGDFVNHPVGYFIEGLVSELDKTRFSLYGYSTITREDETTKRLKSHFSKWMTIKGLSDQAAATQIHEDGVDILIDLSGHTSNNRLPLFAWRPARIQASWLGYFSTTGVEQMDYLIGDPYSTPISEESHFTEKLWQLPESYLCFTPPQDATPVAALPALKNGYVTFGSFNSLSKLNGEVICLWAEVLKATPTSKLFLKTRQFNDEETCKFIRDLFVSLGIDSDRLILEGWSPRAELLSSYSRVDIALDPFPYPGGTTSAEGLWMGVPVLTRRGDRFLSHIGESIANNAGYGEWVAMDNEEYIKMAVNFASDIPMLTNLRAEMRNKLKMSPLFDAKRFAANFGDAIETIASLEDLNTYKEGTE